MNADANVMDYSYSVLDVPFRKALQGMFNKAVRVTTAVKEKIGNGFRKNFTVAGIEKQQVDLVGKMAEQLKPEESKPVDSVSAAVNPIPMATATEEENYLISKTVDETSENLGVLLDKVNQLEKQKKVIMFVKRVALYTPELLQQTFDKAKKWFGDFSKIVNIADAVAPTINTSESTVVSNASTEAQKQVEIPTPSTPVMETKQATTPTVEPAKVPTFNWDSIMSNIQSTPVQNVVENTPVNIAADSVVNTVASFELPDFGMNIKTQENVVEPVMKVESPKEPTIVTKYRVVGKTPKSNVLPFVKKEEIGSFNIENQKDDLPTHGAIIARLYRLGEIIKEKTAQISKLNADLDTAKAATAAANDKVTAYDKVNSSLAEKIHMFTEQVTSLKADLEQARAARLEVIKTNEEKIAMMKAEYEMQLSKASDEKEAIKTEYERKLADANAKRSEEIARINAEYKQTMYDIYSGMQNIQATDEMPLANTQSEETDPYSSVGSYSFEYPQKQRVA